MDMRQAMSARHTVRSYTDEPLSEHELEQIGQRLSKLNAEYGVSVRLCQNDESAFNAALKILFAKNVKNYFVLAGDGASPDMHESLGMAGADLMLFCQTLGLNTWWVAGTFSRAKVAQNNEGKSVIGIIAVGHGATQGKPHRSKTADEVSSYEGEAPAWFKEGVKAALLAPTGLNKQGFVIHGEGRKVSISYKPGHTDGEDLGIVKYHFQLGAGKENFDWA